ncbi:MAG: 50S ribosomal protein L5 [Candidatus Levybacteria bacterium RIFCSPLOWO2_01_FULL_36_13]|nr:MAG: 50S ribosomal protein L5 [Candidatus Levybacteria bacterium RIFCSPHIGHO2_01_FULL_36_15b]OGH35025.1 MAG: 50S ribosomal protein L5 [Candidatus Levybacteria bacterium RIFCSPLOWO2_01_FULL_36_13]
MNTLQQNYTENISKKLKEDLGIKNVNRIPKLSKIVLNMGVKGALDDKKNIEKAAEILALISGQKPAVMKAKKSISTFKLREGDPVGVMVTLRGRRMYDFYQKLTSIVFPRLRDFHGVKLGSFDGRGNYTLGFAESTVFPEIDPSKADLQQGLEISIVTTAEKDDEGRELLKALGMPFQK